MFNSINNIQVDTSVEEPKDNHSLVSFAMKCDVCNASDNIVGVFASSLSPATFAYCKSCAESSAEPYGVLVTRLSVSLFSSADYDSQVRDSVKSIVDSSLRIVGKTKEQFFADLDVAIKKYEASFE
ncbi:hypothetical protein P4I89_08490 [Bacillus cereus]|uniref:hypothetical protein n=1 Tax=Bacillus cereus group TaxID=86661 RepID=UPI001298BD02|nr:MULTISPECIES: hypothetical protein [Bacillus cereus group]MEB9509536.1 hypothetical protein [Bacillus cereus]MRC02948.1 hypothetical protein [Bacillus thuringiensis]MRC76461.1 hypothetical protein [Bacillus thuringiensis]